MESPPQVKTVAAGRCKFESVPPWIERLPAVEKVQLRANRIRRPPAWLLRMTNLVVVDLRSGSGSESGSGFEVGVGIAIGVGVGI